MSDLYFVKGMPLQAFILASQAPKLMKILELHNKNVPKRFKEPWLPEAQSAIEREERLATVWITFLIDAAFSVNSCWAQSMDLAEVRCYLPTSQDEWRKKVSQVYV